MQRRCVRRTMRTCLLGTVAVTPIQFQTAPLSSCSHIICRYLITLWISRKNLRHVHTGIKGDNTRLALFVEKSIGAQGQGNIER